jgi:site-specific DNA recombinase
MARLAAKYRRISQDREGRELGIQRQDEDLDDLAERRGLTVVDSYVDNDVGASSGSRKPRPDYQRLVADAKAGRFSVILAYTSGRLTRRPREFEDLVDLAVDHSIDFVFVRSPEFDLRTAQGRRMARMLAAQDAGEAEELGERVSRAARQRAERGGHHGGARCFGYGPIVGLAGHTEKRVSGDSEPCPDSLDWCKGHRRLRDHNQIVPAEAAEIVRLVDGLLAGVPLYRMVRDLNARGVGTVGGKQWHALTVRQLLMRPRLAGLSSHRGQIVGKGQWSQIITEDQHHAVVALLRDPSRRTTTGNRAAYLLSGLAKCGVCGGSITSCGVTQSVSAKGVKSTKRRVLYRCRSRACAAVARDWADEWVVEHLIARLSREDAADLLVDEERPDSTALADEAHAIRLRLDEAAAAFARQAIDARQLEIITADLNGRQEEIREAQQHTSRAPILRELVEAGAGLADADAREAAVLAVWKRMTLERHRAVLQCLVDVTVNPGGGGRKSFDPNKVEVAPKA